MANSFWNFVTQLVPNNLAKAEDVNTNLAGISAGLDLVEAQTVSSIKVTDTPGVINISATPVNRANKIISFDGAGDVLATIFIGNYRNSHVAVAGTAYNVRDTVKDSTGAIGQDNIYICNTTHTSTGTLAVDVANWDILVDVAAVAASAAAALTSENNAAASFTSFDNRYLGAKAADPTLDNSGGALIDGATYFDTTLNRTKVYDLGTTTWLLTTANAVDVAITDAGAVFTATEVESALQEVKIQSDGYNPIIQSPPVTAGTATAYTATLGIASLAIGVVYKVRIHTSNGAAPTLKLDGTVIAAILTINGFIPVAGELPLNYIAEFYWDGASFIWLNSGEADGLLKIEQFRLGTTTTIGTGGIRIPYDTFVSRSHLSGWDSIAGRFGDNSIELGWYRVTASAVVTNAIIGDSITIALRHNTSIFIGNALTYADASEPLFSVTGDIKVTAVTDTIETYIINNNRITSTVFANAVATNMTVEFLGV